VDRPAAPLAEGRLALVTTAGLHVRGDRPFVAGETRYRVVPTTVEATDLVQSHTSLGFDRTAIRQDHAAAVLPARRRRSAAAGR